MTRTGDTYLQLFRHSAVYAIGQLLFRASSIVLLPVYTRYLRPADYAAVAILDLSTGLLGILVGAGMASSLIRHHFDDRRDDYRAALWWTGLTLVGLTATAVIVPAWLVRNALSDAILGPEISRRELYLTLALPQVWFGVIGQVGNAFLRVRKWSGSYVGLSLARLVVNIALNLVFLVQFEMGAAGILLGNLIAAALYAVTQLAVVAVALGAPRFDLALAAPLWRYGRPLIVTALLALLMHSGDRYLLRLFVDMESIGVYSLAYVIGQGVNTMFVFSFSAIWSVSIYEIGARPNAPEIFAEVFRHFFHALALVVLAVSLLAEPLLELLVAPDYRGAADLLPIICLAYLFFGLHEHFRVPVLLAKKTSLLPPVFLIGVLLNLVTNLILDPFFGVAGAAWASLVTFAGLVSFGLWRYRTLARYPYPFPSCGSVLIGMVAAFAAYRGSCAYFDIGPAGQLLSAGALWIAWASYLFGGTALVLVREMPSRRARA